ncbi:MAG: CDP-diacylglycerol--glycerol-3-phosphate 3-phosphatidyltransferase [Oligoflexia bacterium]|nr:CDP-diacylglycerol--glycerol-3-phosphate 3-phosphatidyltransferase [Oligoflexia bacterium]
MKAQQFSIWKKKLPNFITWMRMAFIPVVVYLLIEPNSFRDFWAAMFFITASLSDLLDGYLARLYKVESVLGQLMDPVADKLLVMGALVMLIPLGRVNPILVLLLLSRDIFIAGIRAAAANEKLVIAAGSMGKWKTGFQMVAIPALLLNRNLFGIDLIVLGTVLLWTSMALSIVSAIQYSILFFKNSKS